jgi:hypothetical protein
MMTVSESGLNFGPFPEDNFFPLEQSELYRHIQQGVSICEFALIRPRQDGAIVWLVEAKSSSPRPDKDVRFNEYIDEIRQKLSNALVLLLAALLDRHTQGRITLPCAFQALTHREEFRLILVINGHPDAWLVPVQEALQVALKPLVRTFGLPGSAVIVLNEQGARRLGLVAE